jgi:hypothetical protein
MASAAKTKTRQGGDGDGARHQSEGHIEDAIHSKEHLGIHLNGVGPVASRGEAVVRAGGVAERREFIAQSGMKADPGENLDRDHRRNDPVDDHAEGWPPAGVGDEVSPVLPQVLEAVAGQSNDQ